MPDKLDTSPFESLEIGAQLMESDQTVEMDPATALGQVASPAGQEATSEEFSFWVAEETLVEKTQIVHAISAYQEQQIVYHAVVEEVYRRSRRRDVLEEADRFGGQVGEVLPLESQGVTYATARILDTAPPRYTPPREESLVFLSGAAEARLAWGVQRMAQPLPVGLLRNGGSAFAGPACLDLDYLLGANGAHVNVNGVAGAATKSSFLTCLLACLLEHCRAVARHTPSARDKPAVVPIILNVKGFDLLWLDRPNRRYAERQAEEEAIWRAIGVAQPGPFVGARFFAPEQAAARAAVPVGREVERYSWSLGDVVREGLFPYLFGDEEREDENFLGILQDVEAYISTDGPARGDGVARRLAPGPWQTFDELLDWLSQQIALPDNSRALRNHHPGTWRKFFRRLRRVIHEGAGVLVRDGEVGQPLNLVAGETRPPAIVDLQSLRDPALQRFVVAAIFAQVRAARQGTRAVPNLAYVIVLDELNRWAPRGASDPITRLIETVVAELRSQGIILFGAQQQASLVSTRVIENCAVRVLGRTGSQELSNTLWGFLSPAMKRRAQALGPEDKLVYQVNFREPMQVRVPYPAWAMRRDEAELGAPDATFNAPEEW